jgi:hypothetical protein
LLLAKLFDWKNALINVTPETFIEQEFEGSHQSRRLLIVLSDFIQEDREVDFRTDVRFETATATRKFATTVAQRDADRQRGTQIYLGLLRSREYATLSPKRRDAIEDFWMEYSKALGGQPGSVTDGVGLVESYLKSDYDFWGECVGLLNALHAPSPRRAFVVTHVKIDRGKVVNLAPSKFQQPD